MKRLALIVWLATASTLVISAGSSAQDLPEMPPWLPATVLTARPEFGVSGAFGPRTAWGGLTLEPWFMPTPDRQFIAAPMASFGWGAGRLDVFSQWAVAIGLGYQWYFGAAQATNVYLMAHVGGGQITRREFPTMPFGYGDVTLGSLHRWKNGFVFGGALIADGLVGRTTRSDKIFGGPAWPGYLEMWRLGLVFGYAVH
jgi:hypothetical protein